MNKKSMLFFVLLSLISFSVKAQWFDFSENEKRAVLGFNTGVAGFRSVGEMNKVTFSDIGAGVNLVFKGVWLDCLYVMPDHRFDSHIVQENWDDHSALVINAGYQIPIYKSRLFITPLIGLSRATIGYTEGNNIGIDVENHSIYHKYTVTEATHQFNYGGALTVRPFKRVEIDAIFTSHAAYAGIGIDITSIKE